MYHVLVAMEDVEGLLERVITPSKMVDGAKDAIHRSLQNDV